MTKTENTASEYDWWPGKLQGLPRPTVAVEMIKIPAVFGHLTFPLTAITTGHERDGKVRILCAAIPRRTEWFPPAILLRLDGSVYQPRPRLPDGEQDTHTEHCCAWDGCKYGRDNCSVTTGNKPQSHLCESCHNLEEEGEYDEDRDG